MPLQSDLPLDYSKFDPNSVSQKTKDFNEKLIKILEGIPPWYEVGAQRYRQMRANGETPLPKPVHLPQAQTMTIPSRDTGRDIPCRVFKPKDGSASKGVFYHIHGGGWVLMDEATQDPLLEAYAENFKLTVVSVGYRLAPEDPFPAGPNDCYDVGEWLVDRAQSEFRAPLVAAGGESAGAHLAALATFHLQKTRPSFAFKGLVLTFGAYDLSTFLPSTHTFKRPLVLYHKIMEKYIEALLPGTTADVRTDPSISPLFADLASMKLPPALFTVGTEDPLLDDSVVMATKWCMAGGKGVLKVYPGSPHGFNLFGEESSENVAKWKGDLAGFMGDYV